MYSKTLFLSMAIVIALFGFDRKIEAQKRKQLSVPSNLIISTNGGHCEYCCNCQTPTPPQNDTIGQAPLYCNTPTLADLPVCDSLDANGDINVNFSLATSEFTRYNKIFIVNKEIFTNNTSCNMNFVACAMVSYAPPPRDQNTPDSLDNLPWGENENEWTIKQEDTCTTCSTHCNYTCQDISTTFEEYWSYYFGCADVNLAPGQTKSVFSGSHGFNGPILASLKTFDSTTKPIFLSQNPVNPNPTDIADTTTTWNYNAMYIDFLKGCQFLNLDGCDFGNEAGQELSQQPVNYTCTIPEWYYKGKIQKAYHGRSYPTGILSFPVGNQATTTLADTNNAHTVYQAEFIGYIANAPAGTELIVYAPVDTSGRAAVIDSGIVWTDTLTDCQSDTLRFEFPFVIPPMQYVDRGMSFVLQFPPDSCSNVGNGKRIYLNGWVMANASTPLYDSGAFMYKTEGTIVFDTTSPVVTNFHATVVDPTHLAIRLTGIDTSSSVIFGAIEYTINGGPVQVMALNYLDSVEVGDTTNFIDTLVSPVSYPVISIVGLVGNEFGVLDSAYFGTYPLQANPQSVTGQQEDSLRVNYLMIDHQSKILTLDVQAVGTPIELDLVTEDGRSTKLTSETSSPDGEQKFVESFSNFANGAYFLLIRSGNDSIVENIIL